MDLENGICWGSTREAVQRRHRVPSFGVESHLSCGSVPAFFLVLPLSCDT